MHSDQPYFLGNPMLPFADQLGSYMQNAPTIASGLNSRIVPSGINPLMPFHNIDIKPSDTCPRNFIIFDQTNNRSQVMYHHPGINSKPLYPVLDVVDKPIFQDFGDQKDEIKISSSMKEDSDDIDALLSTEYEENQEYDDDDDEEVSTARTNAVYECNSPDSCSNYEPVSKKSRSLFRKPNEKKRQRMRKMVKALKGIVPGANRMSTVAVLDEAVRYLKSLRVEVRKLGVGNSKI